MGEEDKYLDEQIQSHRDIELLKKILNHEEIKLWKEILRWVNEVTFFTSTAQIEQYKGVKQEEKKKEEAIYYTFDPIPWLIHQYWNKPKIYLKERLEQMRSRQLWMLNIYSAILITGVLGIWVYSVSKLIEFRTDIGKFFENPIGYAFDIICFIVLIAIVIAGIVLSFKDKWRRKITRRIHRTLIRGMLNNYDIESCVIAKIYEIIEKQEEGKESQGS